jgi:hypothetical protein
MTHRQVPYEIADGHNAQPGKQFRPFRPDTMDIGHPGRQADGLCVASFGHGGMISCQVVRDRGKRTTKDIKGAK